MDPLTLYAIGTGVSLGTQAIASGIQGYQGRQEQKRAEAAEKELRDQGLPQMETPEEYFDLYEKYKEGRASQLAIENAQMNFANVSDTLMRAGGARGAQSLLAASRQNTQDIYGLAAAQEDRELMGLEKLASAQMDTNRINTAANQQLFMNDLAGAQAAYQAGREMRARATDNLTSAISAAGQAAASAGIQGGAFGFTPPNPDPSGKKTIFGINEDGGKFEKKGMKTPGEFSHKENPIDLVRDGKKIGEATGGEYIFNPEQSEKMRELAEKEKSPLSKYVVGLLNKFDNQAKKR